MNEIVYSAVQTTCDVYRTGESPPSIPDVESVICTVIPCFAWGRESGESHDEGLRYTHIMDCPLATDIRDAFNEFTPGSNDTVYIPHWGGIGHNVVFVEKRDTQRRVYLNRKLPTWPLDSGHCSNISTDVDPPGVSVTDCCPSDDVPAELLITFTATTGVYTCLEDLSTTITWDSASSIWIDDTFDIDCPTPSTNVASPQIECDAISLAFEFAIQGAYSIGDLAASSLTCSPFEAVFLMDFDDGMDAGTATATVTEVP